MPSLHVVDRCAAAVSDGSERTIGSMSGLVNVELIVEVRASPADPWPEWSPTLVNMRLHVFNASTQEMEPMQRLFVHRDASLSDLSVAVAAATGIPRAQQRLLRIDRSSSTLDVFEVGNNVALAITTLSSGFNKITGEGVMARVS